MNQYYMLFNPHAGKGNCKEDVEKLAASYENATCCDMTQLNGYETFMAGLDASDSIVICGGDGTLNRFINETRGLELKNPLYYYAVGSGNDFLRDVSENTTTKTLIPLNDYIKDLPTVTVNGKEYLFLNGVGYGIDGYCCEVGNQIKATSDKPVNYTSIAIKGLLFHYKPTNATVTVDGKTSTYKRVWIAPTMNGRYYGGGMMPTPAQNRLNEKKELSLLVFHNGGKLRTLTIFPKLFQGEHVSYKKQVEILTGHDIKVQFDRPVALQVDGETILNVTEYHAKSRR